MAAHQPQRSFRQLPAWQADTLEEDLAELLRRLQTAGLNQVVVVDLSKPAFGIAVARTVIPGLEGAYEDAHSDYVPGPRALALLQNQS